MISKSRMILALVLSIGFMVLIGMAMFVPLQDSSQRIVDTGIGALGSALATAIAGIFRTDRADEQRAMNTGAAIDTINSALYADMPKGLKNDQTDKSFEPQ